jgi:hypothetical protein
LLWVKVDLDVKLDRHHIEDLAFTSLSLQVMPDVLLQVMLSGQLMMAFKVVDYL